MIRVMLADLRAHRRRLLLSGCSVALGVLLLSTSLVFMATVNEHTTRSYADKFRDVDAVVALRAPEAGGDSYPPVTVVDGGLAEQVARAGGVAADRVVAVVSTPGVRVLGRDGKLLHSGAGVQFGTNWRTVDPYRRLRAGRPPVADDEIAVNLATADSAGTRLGGQITLLGDDLRQQVFTVVGLYGYRGGSRSLGGGDEVAFATPTAGRVLLGDPGAVTALYVMAPSPGATAGAAGRQRRLRDTLAAALGSRYQVRTGAQVRDSELRWSTQGRALTTRLLVGFALVTMVVGALMTFNTFSILVAGRIRQLALLRALGASRRQVTGSVLAEAAAVGFAGALLGLAVSVGLGALLRIGIQGMLAEPVTLVVPPAAVLGAFGAGIPVTMLASLRPALAAAGIPPVAALRRVAGGADQLPARAGRLARGGQPGGTTGGRRAPGRVGGWAVAATLGWRNARRHPGRSAATAAALMIGVTLAAGTSVVVASADASLRGAATADLRLALLVSASPTGAPSPVAPTAVGQIAAMPGVRAAVGQRREGIEVTVPGRGTPQQVDLAAVSDLAATVRLYSLRPVAGRLAEPTPQTVLVDEPTAHRYRLHPGQVVTVTGAGDRSMPVTVAGVYAESPFLPGWLAGPAVGALLVGDRPTEVAVELAGGDARGATGVAVRRAVEAMFAADPTVTVQSRDEVVAQVGAGYDRVLLGMLALLALALVVAVLGVVNTLVLSVLERTGELGVLRAVGAPRRLLTRMIACESVVLAGAGGLAGVLAGTGLGLVGARLLAGQGITRLVVPVGQLGGYLVAAVVVGVVAAVLPARRAGRLPVLTAVTGR